MEEKIAIFGGSGFIGKELARFLKNSGHDVLLADRKNPESPLYWNAKSGILSKKILENTTVVINLSGENIYGRWTSSKKNAILSSRVSSTEFIAKEIQSLKRPPKVFITASATGYYGANPNFECDENSPNGNGFLAFVCAQNEQAAKIASNTRIITLRQGVVIGKNGGMVKTLTPFFKCFLGAKISDGNNYMPWISILDLLRTYEFLIKNEFIFGAVNAVSPLYAKNAEFSEALAKSLDSPLMFSVPKWIIRLFFGEMANELILSNQKIFPKKLLDANFKFHQPKIEDTL